ncbi:MAG: hypothetical protein R6X32_05950 [Chloroflexota bacterium]
MKQRLIDLRELMWDRPENRLISISLFVFFWTGLAIGLLVLGWWLWPVAWTDATPAHLDPTYRTIYLRQTADLYAYEQDPDRVIEALLHWRGDRAACDLARQVADPAEKARLVMTAYTINGIGCTWED